MDATQRQQLVTGTQQHVALTRRSMLLGSLALATLLGQEETRGEVALDPGRHGGLAQLPHFRPRARRVIYLFQSGGPAQMDLFDYKPELRDRFGEEVPKSVYPDDRKTTMSSAQASFPVAPSIFKFKQHGEAGTWVSKVLPHTARMVDEMCVIRSMFTEAINHDPAITFLQTGAQLPGRPSMGAWLSYGLGHYNADLPAFVAMSSKGSAKAGQPLYERLWGSGFLPSLYQGIKFRNVGQPVLDIANPEGISQSLRREMLDRLNNLNRMHLQQLHDPEIATRISQYELAFRMQMSIPELLDLRDEPQHVLDLYGPDVEKQGTYAYNCLIARRLIERGVRFVQLFHQGWDSHNNVPVEVPKQCRDTDQPTAALIADLKQRGLLEDTLIVWGGEFGRTIYCQGTPKPGRYGRDHHAHCFTMWLAGGGIKGGTNYGATDDYSVNPVEKPVSVHDLHATILYLLGIDHQRFTYRFQGRDFRLTDVAGKVIHEIVA